MALLIVVPAVSVGTAQTSCTESRLVHGGFGRVTPGYANNLRAEPSPGADHIAQIPGGGAFVVAEDDPVCENGRLWIAVTYGDTTGWTVEVSGDDYWIEPYDAVLYEDDVIRFIYPADYLTDIEPETAPAEERMGGFYPTRQTYQLVMDAATDQSHARFRTIRILPADEISADTSIAYDSLQALRPLTLAPVEFERPIFETWGPDYSQEDNILPLDPTFLGAGRTFVFAPQSIALPNGRGVRFIAMHAQDILPVYNEGLFYNLLALTNDGAYYVVVRLPIAQSDLLDDYSDFDFPLNWDEVYSGYRTQTIATLDALDPNDWTPSLHLLDTIAGSIQVIGPIPEIDE